MMFMENGTHTIKWFTQESGQYLVVLIKHRWSIQDVAQLGQNCNCAQCYTVVNCEECCLIKFECVLFNDTLSQ